jgi:hypothetical protein
MLTLPGVRPRRVAVFGVSRGTEAALQLAAMSSAVDAVVARSPSLARWEGITAHDLHLSYDQVGHSIPCEYLPNAGDFSGLKIVIGGTAEGVAKAQRDSWPRILAFLTQAASAASP